MVAHRSFEKSAAKNDASINSATVASRSDLFVCVKVLQPSQPNGVMSSLVSLPNHTFTGQAFVLKAVNQYCAHSFARN